MKPDGSIFSAQEEVVFALRSLYERFGYSRFPVRRFEEYGLYLENKSFLKSESVLAFANANGKLMALKPDVTLSIVKHAKPKAKSVEKLYYNESVYRVSQTDREFCEIEQLGVELLGQVDVYGMCEVLRLAAESLQALGREYVLEISHMGFADGLMNAARLEDSEKAELFRLIQQKNGHELRTALKELPISAKNAEIIEGLTHLSGSFAETLKQAEAMVLNDEMKQAVDELRQIYQALSPLALCENLRLDFSILNDLDYYNGLVFQGYVRGVPRVALSGGRYDHLMRKFDKTGGGIGFALYLDEVGRIFAEPSEYDVEVLALYGEGDDMPSVFRAADELRQNGDRVLAAPEAAGGLRPRRIMKYADGRFQEVE